MTTVRSMITVEIKKNWKIFQLDVNNAFLHGDLHEEIYINIPQGLNVQGPNIVCQLKKSLYGLRKASRQWYSKLSDALRTKGYQNSKNDYSLFYKKSENSAVLLVVYVDDIVITGNDENEINALKLFLDT